VRRFLATPERYNRIDEPGLRIAGIVDFSLCREDLDSHRLTLQEKKITRLGLLLVAPAVLFDQNSTRRRGSRSSPLSASDQAKPRGMPSMAPGGMGFPGSERTKYPVEALCCAIIR